MSVKPTTDVILAGERVANIPSKMGKPDKGVPFHYFCLIMYPKSEL